MGNYFATMFEDLRHGRSIIWILSITDPHILNKSKYTDHKLFIIKKLASENLQRQRFLKEYVTVYLMERFFLFIKNWFLLV